jgi:hypothetical protein
MRNVLTFACVGVFVAFTIGAQRHLPLPLRERISAGTLAEAKKTGWWIKICPHKLGKKANLLNLHYPKTSKLRSCIAMQK